MVVKEFGLIAGLVLLMLLITALPVYFSALHLVKAGAYCVVFGFGWGLPLATIYHLKLFRYLKESNVPATGWWLDPRPLHNHLSLEQKQDLKRFFWMGGLGFVGCVIGCILIFCSLLSQY